MRFPGFQPWQLGAALLLVVVIIIASATYFLGRLEDMIARDFCGVNVRRIVPSPTGSSSLVTFEVGCGATTPVSSQISLIPNGASFSRESYPPFFSIKGVHDLAPQWVNADSVQVSVPTNAEIFRKLPRVNGVVIGYR